MPVMWQHSGGRFNATTIGYDTRLIRVASQCLRRACVRADDAERWVAGNACSGGLGRAGRPVLPQRARCAGPSFSAVVDPTVLWWTLGYGNDDVMVVVAEMCTMQPTPLQGSAIGATGVGHCCQSVPVPRDAMRLAVYYWGRGEGGWRGTGLYDRPAPPFLVGLLGSTGAGGSDDEGHGRAEPGGDAVSDEVGPE